jgi:DNA-binding response OmpR family regulator
VASSARRQRDQRLVSRCRVEFDRPSGAVVAETEDLSPRGLFIRTDALLDVGEETEVRLVLPDGELLVFRGRVAHLMTPTAARSLGRHPGMGFEILGPDSVSRIKLRSHVESLKGEITNPGMSTTTQVIIVEPTAPLRSRMQRSLEAAGFKVTAVDSVPDALQACEMWRPDAIIAAAADIDGMTGVDFAYAMSEHSSLSDVPLVLTGDDGDLGRLEAFRAGVRDYIPRPFLDEELVIRIHRVAAPQTPANNPGMRGSLVDIGLGTLLSLFEFERKSGILVLVRPAELARVFLSEGRVLKLEVTAANGAASPSGVATPRSTKQRAREQMLSLLDWRDGQFEFSPAAIGGRDEIGLTITQLLLEHARTRDEARAAAGT